MRVLELFKGGGSISKYFESMPNVEVISLDILPKYKPTICCDIMEWDYKQYPKDYFTIIWGSCECKVFSTLQYCLLGRKGGCKTREELTQKQKENSKYFLKTFEIINYFNCKYWFVENPMYSHIWDYIPENLEYNEVNVSYCKFGFDYQKNTRIITNKKVLECCLCRKVNGIYACCGLPKHKSNMGKLGSQKQGLVERYSIPQKLLQYLFCEF